VRDLRRRVLSQLERGSIGTRVHPGVGPFLEAGQYPTLARQRRAGIWQPDALLAAGELLPLADAGLVITDDAEEALIDRLRVLQEQLDLGTVTVVIIPPNRPAGPP
jgi:hypothetical protein